MKLIIVMIACLIGTGTVGAQAHKKTISRTVAKPAPKNTQKPFVLNSAASNTAKTDSAFTGSKFDISDPIILSLSTGSYTGREAKWSSSGIYNMPKGSYGFSNGKITFNTTGATSSGGITGVGSVGTGSTMGNIGSNGLRGSNGKNLFAGNEMWGNVQGLNFRRDTTRRGIGY